MKIDSFFSWSRCFVIAMGCFIISCSSNDENTTENLPEIIGLEVGVGNNHIGYIGVDLHIEAEVVAEERIHTIEIKISKESEDDPWEFLKIYNEFSGQRNAYFHKHIDIPTGITPGDYRFDFIVTDQAGNKTEETIGLQIVFLDDNEPPVINIITFPSEGQVFSEGESISISGFVSDNNSLAELLVVLVREDSNILDEEIAASDSRVIVMTNIQSFDTPDFQEFLAEIKVGAEYDNNTPPKPIGGQNAWQLGGYYLLVLSKDVNGNIATSIRYPVVLE